MTEISESRTREIQHWLDDRLAEPDLPYQAMAMLRDAAALIRQLQAAEQAAWHAGLDAGREQWRGNERMKDALEMMAEQHRCGCGHPHCNNCARDRVCAAALAPKEDGDEA